MPGWGLQMREKRAEHDGRNGTLSPRGTLILFGLTLGLLILRIGAIPLIGPDEPRYARVAVEMHRGRNWVVPTLGGEPWLEKPPLYYWLAGASFSVLGETEAAARLPSVAAGLLLVGATALFGARLYGGAAGLHAGFILGTSLLVFVYGHAAAMDMLLAATVSVAIGLMGLRLLGIAGRLAVPAAYVFMGLATLAKGPLGLLLPGLVIGGEMLASRGWRIFLFAFLLCALAGQLLGPFAGIAVLIALVLATGRWKTLGEVVSPVGILLFLLVAGPWYLSIYLSQGWHFVDVFLLQHNLERFITTIHHHPGALYYYVPVVLIGLFPWSGLLFPALLGMKPGHSAADRFVLLWLILPLGFFSLAGSKLPGYVLPCLPPLALAMGRSAASIAHGERLTPWAARGAALVGLALAGLVAALPFLLSNEGDRGWTLAVPCAVWALLVTFAFSRRVTKDGAGSISILRVGAAGFLLLVGLAAPSILARRESGRELFLPAQGREVLAFGAWRTAFMAGYFYNDGRVREVQTVEEIARAAKTGAALVICGPTQRAHLEALTNFKVLVLAEGPRRNSLLRIEPR
jgi:4-amino-4-deoxy-L-arabinose transferase-like glycosyltransferase